MKRFVMMMCTIAALTLGTATAQTDKKTPPHQPNAATSTPERTTPAESADDIQQLNADLQRLKGLLNQMRTNLAFVQTSQSPLKHQFELETDAWQVLIDQMEHRLKRMNERSASGSGR